MNRVVNHMRHMYSINRTFCSFIFFGIHSRFKMEAKNDHIFLF